MKTPSVVSIVAALMLLNAASTSAAPPDLPFDGRTWPALSKAKPSTGLKLGTLVINFEDTTLGSVAKALGGSIAHHGDAGGSIYWLCYTGPHERVWIVSHGEMGGSDHAVDYVIGQELAGGAAKADCPALPKTAQPIVLTGGLWLGAGAGAVRASLGQPSFSNKPWQSYDYEGKEPGRCEPDGFDVMNWLIVEMHGDRVTRIYAGQVTSC